MTYRWNASDYAKHSAGQQIWARELIARLDLQGREEILDIGCGDGKVTAELASYVPGGSVLGIDNSPGMVELARASYPPALHPNLRFELVDARELPFLEAFDVVFSNATLHWILDHRPVLAGISRSLRPDGRILLQMGGQGNAAAVIAVLEEMMREDAWRGYFAEMAFPYGFHGVEPYHDWLREASLDPRRVELLPKDMVHDSPEGLAGWIRTTWLPYTDRVPEAQRERFVSEFVARYLDHHPLDAQGRAHVRMIRLEVEAHKR